MRPGHPNGKPSATQLEGWHDAISGGAPIACGCGWGGSVERLQRRLLG